MSKWSSHNEYRHNSKMPNFYTWKKTSYRLARTQIFHLIFLKLFLEPNGSQQLFFVFSVPAVPGKAALSPTCSSLIPVTFSRRTERAAQVLRDLFALLRNKGQACPSAGEQSRWLRSSGTSSLFSAIKVSSVIPVIFSNQTERAAQVLRDIFTLLRNKGQFCHTGHLLQMDRAGGSGPQGPFHSSTP